ncbi:type II toxin-antitoxin system death-on-curing family toxin [Rhodohalobacter barkolensis]|uniref:Type II toxin-antitoxin system death-on-curing family toxin n=1 Tax=Rhodohalobacter barkolensis TaxID=2053187 RepID=A0A2N0VE21_9BACT|nr:type II toxin-antitoxin system death-on-curing family toxin [Rhodohalobacter barkolensis]PKD42439.1 type II toxin-antitoxin system death-on-curing family toxin [Rhodohalobacter barkolensis]
MPHFLTLDDILFIHRQEIKLACGETNIRDKEGVRACVDAPQATFGEDYLQDIFGMAASYLTCLVIRHPFVDGNKRAALASALTFLYLNGYSVNEEFDLELARLVLDFLAKKKSKEDVVEHFRSKAFKR